MQPMQTTIDYSSVNTQVYNKSIDQSPDSRGLARVSAFQMHPNPFVQLAQMQNDTNTRRRIQTILIVRAAFAVD